MVNIHSFALLSDLCIGLNSFSTSINMASVYSSPQWATIASICCSPCVFKVCQTNSKVTQEKINTDGHQHCGPAVFSTSSIFADTQLTVTRHNHFAISLIFTREPRMALFFYNGAFKCQEKDRRQCLRRDLAHCRGKSLQPEPEAGPIKNTCPTTNPSTEPTGPRLWRQRLRLHPCA